MGNLCAKPDTDTVRNPNVNFGIPPPRKDEYREVAWGLDKKGGKFAPMYINRAKPGDNDIKFDVLYCGICHSDCTQAEFYPQRFEGKEPFIPGHEFIGRVSEVGKKVKNFKVGDNVGVGCFVDACDTCKDCKEGEV